MKWQDKVEKERVRGDKPREGRLRAERGERRGEEKGVGRGGEKERKGAEFNMFEYSLR